MSEQEKFLDRWSRRKQEAEKADPEKSAAVPAADQAAAPVPDAEGVPQSGEPEFDLSKLPSLDSITAVTDIRAFLSAGVPAHLTRAALRNAWAADPAIRDFIGLSENAWDFNDPASIPGFGTIDSTGELRRMTEQVFNEVKQAVKDVAGTGEESHLGVPVGREGTSGIDESPRRDAPQAEELQPAAVAQESDAKMLIQQSSGDAAAHNVEHPVESVLPVRKRHGGALPV